MLVDETLPAVDIHDNGEVIKSANDAFELEAVDQEDGDNDFFLARLVQKDILNVLLLHDSCLLLAE